MINIVKILWYIYYYTIYLYQFLTLVVSRERNRKVKNVILSHLWPLHVQFSGDRHHHPRSQCRGPG